MFYIIVTEQDHQESFVGYCSYLLRSETSVPSGRMAQANVGSFGDEVNNPWNVNPYRGESWFLGDFLSDFLSVFYLLIIYEGSVIVIVFHVVSKDVCFYFDLDP